MKNLTNKVKEFHTAFKLNESQNYKLNPQISKLRYDLMREENEEYLVACNQNDEIEIADALGDQLYVLIGTILSHGLENKIEEVFNEIHKSNMSKLDENGQPLYNDRGKVMKSKLFFKPDIKKVLYEQDSEPYTT